MEVIWLSALSQDWWVPAVCDFVALSSMVAVALLLARPKRRASVRLEPSPVAVPAPLSERSYEPPVPEPSAPARSDVKRALAAIGRWEDSYRAGRGVAELARFVQSQSSREDRTR